MYRIGCVPYLNARPLIYTLSQCKDIDLILKPPSQLGRLLKNGKLDVALIPTIEYFRYKYYKVISRDAITSHKKIGSVRLYYSKPIPYIKTVALDSNSATSNALTKVLLKKMYNINPKYILYNPAGDKKVKADAFVIIGDRAFGYSPLPHIDLGSEWHKLTKLPFVYAMWVVNSRFTVNAEKLHHLKQLLTNSKKMGMKSVRKIARDEARKLDLSPTFCLQYLTNFIGYNLGKRELKGLKLFQKYASGLGLCKEGKEIDFV